MGHFPWQTVELPGAMDVKVMNGFQFYVSNKKMDTKHITVRYNWISDILFDGYEEDISAATSQSFLESVGYNLI